MSAFPVAVNKSQSRLPSHVAAPVHPSPVPKDREETLSDLGGPRASGLSSPFPLCCAVPLREPRLPPGRQGLHRGKLFSLYSESYLRFVLFLAFFLD